MPKKKTEPEKFTLAQLQEDSTGPDERSEESFQAPSSSSSSESSESGSGSGSSGSGSGSESAESSSRSSSNSSNSSEVESQKPSVKAEPKKNVHCDKLDDKKAPSSSSSSSSSSMKDDSDLEEETKPTPLAVLMEKEMAAKPHSESEKHDKKKHEPKAVEVEFAAAGAKPGEEAAVRPKRKPKKEGSQSIPLSKIATIRDKTDDVKPNAGEDPDFYLRQSYSKLDLGHMEEKVMLRVYLADNSFKTVYINPKTNTTTDVWRMICEKLQLPQSEWGYFFLWTISSDAELLMYAESTIEDAAKEYPDLRANFSHPVGYRAPGDSRFQAFLTSLTGTQAGKKNLSASKYVVEPDAVTFQDVPAGPKSPRGNVLTQTGMSLSSSMYSIRDVPAYSSTVSGSSGTLATTMRRTSSKNSFLQTISGTGSTSTEGCAAKFMFRLTQILPHIEEMRIKSPAGIRLLFIQGVHDVLVGNHPVSASLAVQLAALQLCAYKGPFRKDSWKEGTVSACLSSYIPQHLHSMFYAKSWESSVRSAYQALGDKMSVIDCETGYVNILKKLPSYGSTYFPVTYTPAEATPLKQFFQGDVTLAINAVGIHLIDVRLCRRKDMSAIVTFPFQRILSWDADKLTFFFEYHKLHCDSGKPSLFSFSTPNASLINDLMHDWLQAFEDFAVERQAEAAAAQSSSASPAVATPTATTTTTTSTSRSKSKSHHHQQHESSRKEHPHDSKKDRTHESSKKDHSHESSKKDHSHESSKKDHPHESSKKDHSHESGKKSHTHHSKK